MKDYDDYNWPSYTGIYSDQIVNHMKGEQFIVENAKVEGNTINWNGDQMHSNMVYIYEKIAKYAPKSIFEGGFGGGQNLYSISKLFPDAIMGGVELLQSQLQFGIEHFKMPSKFFESPNILFGDLSESGIPSQFIERFDFVYTNAVIMHLKSEKAIKFLANLVAMRPKYMVMVEGVVRPGDQHEWPLYFQETKMLDYYDDISEESFPQAKVLIKKGL